MSNYTIDQERAWRQARNVKKWAELGLPTLKCAICGFSVRQLEGHVRTHGITFREYRLKHMKVGESPTAPDIIERKRELAIKNDSQKYITAPEVMERSRPASLSTTSIAKMKETRRGRPKLHKKSETALERGTIEIRKCPCGKELTEWRSSRKRHCNHACARLYGNYPKAK